MARFFRMHHLAVAAVLAAGAMAIAACGSSSMSGGTSPTGTTPPTPAATAPLKVLVTDSPSDDWQQVSVQLVSIGLRNQADRTWVKVWTPPSTATTPPTINLVDLNGVAQYLNSATIPVATYDRAQIVINTDPTTMTLVDDAGNTIPPADIAVVDPSGKGEISLDLSPALSVGSTGTNVLQLDFDLAHPLSIVVESGKVILNLQLRHKVVPKNLRDIQFARTIGQVKAVTASTLTLTPSDGNDVTFGYDGQTIAVDVDNPSATPNIATIPTTDFALVASNMNADGTLYARRVWFSTDVTKLPQFSPDGLVRRIGPDWIMVLGKRVAGPMMTARPSWKSDKIYVDAATAWTFQTSIAMGTGTSVIPFIRRGFRVSVELVDPNATRKVAKSINVQSASDEGPIHAVTATGFTFRGPEHCMGWAEGDSPMVAAMCAHQWTFSTISGHAFSWWFFGLPSQNSTSVADFTDTVGQAMAANLRAFARAELYWDATNNAWVAENVILAPEQVPGPAKVTTAYTAAGGTMGISTFDWDDDVVPTQMTVALDTTGDLQTVVGSVRWNQTTRVLTVTVPVLPAQWESLLTTSLNGVKVWVRPVKTVNGTTATWTWHAYTVIAYQTLN